MICIKCKRKIDHSYGAPQLAGCYCFPCAINNGLTAEQIYAQQVRAATVREMQERLKSLLKTDYINGTREHAISVIDKIAEEMIGETK